MSSVNETDCRGGGLPAGSKWASLVFAALVFSTPLARTADSLIREFHSAVV